MALGSRAKRSGHLGDSLFEKVVDHHPFTLIPDATLEALGQFFAAFKVQQLVGVGLLHKHFKLAQDTIMVHDGHVCKPESSQSSVSATGTSFFWNGTDFQAFEYAQREPLNLPPNFLDAFAGYLESHRLSGQISLSKLDTRGTMSAEHRDPETAFKTGRDTELERAVSRPERREMKQTLIPYKSAPGRKLFMERLDATTNSHIMEEAPSSLPRDATQWAFEGVPVIMHGCARLTDGQRGYIHKKKVRCFRPS